MGKHKPDIYIGYRAAALIREKTPPEKTPAYEMRRLGLDRKLLFQWEAGMCPSAYSLQAMAFCGYDVIYILTGRRTLPKNSAIDGQPKSQ